MPTPTITLTATPPPDVELAQMQIFGQAIIAEIVNHLDVPVIFRDQQPSFRFDVYDPIMDRHWIEEELVNRREGGAPVPCVLYPGEHAFFTDIGVLRDWYLANSNPDSSHLKVTYQSLGVPTPDWTDNSTQLKVSDVQWNIKDHVLYFSFKHNPVTDIHDHLYFWSGTMGLYDNDNHLLGVGGGDIGQTIQTGVADGYWISLDNYTIGDYPARAWGIMGVDDLPDRLDHISIMAEAFKKGGVCFK